ncbi:hypothetical protein TWF481_011031 [Arthrobotrys musiformis]|uniref:Uncharacterized protein n=1 Tax=Arthrobotrys musiformis TaxID=47236 RepID=A0AAV9VX81_9PEZI
MSNADARGTSVRDTFTVQLTPQLPDRPDMIPNMTFENIGADDFLSKVTDQFEAFPGSDMMLLPGEV